MPHRPFNTSLYSTNKNGIPSYLAGSDWGLLNQYLRAWALGRPFYSNYRDDPMYQSPYASDPTSSSARAAAGLNPNVYYTKEQYAADAQAQMMKMLGGILPGFFGNGSGGTGGNSPNPNGGGTDVSGMTPLYRDASGMIYDFGDNPIANQLGQFGNYTNLLNQGMSYLNQNQPQQSSWGGRNLGGYGNKPPSVQPPMTAGELGGQPTQGRFTSVMSPSQPGTPGVRSPTAPTTPSGSPTTYGTNQKTYGTNQKWRPY